MGRSVHTRPKRILAFQRQRAPYDRRGVAALSRRYRGLRIAKEHGAVDVVVRSSGGSVDQVLVPRVMITRAPSGWFYPVDREEIVQILGFFGPEVTYGLRMIRLIPPSRYSNLLRFGSLLVPGEIRLFALHPPPWTLPGVLSDEAARRLSAAGAVMESVGDGPQTSVEWPNDTLHDFVLFDVLMHEVGHHIVQQYTGKRSGRVLRTKDHEAFADRFAQRCREEYAARG